MRDTSEHGKVWWDMYAVCCSDMHPITVPRSRHAVWVEDVRMRQLVYDAPSNPLTTVAVGNVC